MPPVSAVIHEQLLILVEAVLNDPDKFIVRARNHVNKEILNSKWKSLAQELNAVTGGTQKEAVEWKKYWINYKHSIKLKLKRAKINNKAPDLTEIERTVLKKLAPKLQETLEHDNSNNSFCAYKSPSEIVEAQIDVTERNNENDNHPNVRVFSGTPGDTLRSYPRTQYVFEEVDLTAENFEVHAPHKSTNADNEPPAWFIQYEDRQRRQAQERIQIVNNLTKIQKSLDRLVEVNTKMVEVQNRMANSVVHLTKSLNKFTENTVVIKQEK